MSFLLSGDQSSMYLYGPPALVSCTLLPPAAGMRWISSSPDASEIQAIHLPSGDHLGLRSWTPAVFVRLRVCPSLAGTVNRSPRAPKSARLPSGEISKAATLLLTSLSAV